MEKARLAPGLFLFGAGAFHGLLSDPAAIGPLGSAPLISDVSPGIGASAWIFAVRLPRGMRIQKPRRLHRFQRL